MPFLSSLLCFQGADDRSRFALINLVSTLLFAIISLVFIEWPFINVVLTGALSSIIFASTKRRLNDAQLTKQWLYIPVAAFAITTLIISISQVLPLYWLLILPLALSLILVSYPSKHQVKKVLGYSGPVDLHMYEVSNSHRQHRVEPSFSGNVSNQEHEIVDATPATYQQAAPSPKQDLGEQIREFLFNQQNGKKTIALLISIIIVGILFSWLMMTQSSASKTVEEVNNEESIRPVETAYHAEISNVVVLADDFEVATNEFYGVVIQWEVDDNLGKVELWDVHSANGDKSCEKLTFNNKESIRTTKVLWLNQELIQAHFSPLDQSNLINGLAKRGSFSLCGYDFSLKGSQATLGKNSYFQQLL